MNGYFGRVLVRLPEFKFIFHLTYEFYDSAIATFATSNSINLPFNPIILSPIYH